MRLLLIFIAIVATILIRIGDVVLFLLSLIGKALRQILKLASKGLPKKPKKIKSTVFFPLPFTTKLKYLLAGIVFSFIFLFAPLLVVVFIQDLPHPRSITLGQIPQTTKIFDRNGKLLYQIYTSQNRTLIPLSTVPQNLKNATIAIEDKDFYKHPGFDISAIIRSAIENISGGELQGGSTITQQLIKSALLTPETSVVRKIKEVILAFWAERIYSKDEILGLYFNQIPYGGTAWGVEAASQTYFGKHVSDLDLSESAFLAGIPRAPTIYSPFGTQPDLWKKRQKEVLSKMRELGYITKKEEEEALSEELNFQTPQTPIHAPHFVMYVKDLLVKKYGLPMVEKGGLNVVTSLDLNLQDSAQSIVSDEVEKNSYLALSNGASLITNPKNGDILSMVGGRNFSDLKSGNVNVTISRRQPGSSIKAVTYSAALSNGFTAATILDDSPITFPNPGSKPYSPVNYDGKFHGKVSLRIALANSFNIPAVKTLNSIGIPAMVEQGKKMGIKSWGDPKNYGLSITLGAAETTMIDLSTIYGVLANGGVRVDLNPILKVTDSKGEVLEEKGEQRKNLLLEDNNIIGKRVLDEGVAFILSDILADNNARAIEFGTNSPLNIANHRVSVKTGTSDNKRDNWTIGYTDKWLVAAWVGNNDNSPMSQNLASGITGAAPIWNRIMTILLTNTSDNKPALPSDVVQKPCIGRLEYFIKGTENSVNCAPLPSPTPTL